MKEIGIKHFPIFAADYLLAIPVQSSPVGNNLSITHLAIHSHRPLSTRPAWDCKFRDFSMKRVLILTSYDHIYAYAVSSFLRKQKSLEIIQRNLSNGAQLTKITQELEPSAMIVNQALFVEHAAVILETMIAIPDLKLIIMNEKENLIQVVLQKVVTIQTGNDLVDEVLAENAPLLIEN